MTLQQLEQLVIDTIDGKRNFEETLREVARFQARTVPGLGRFWNNRGFNPDDPHWDSARIPAVSTDTFRTARLVSNETPATTVFRTSGTTTGQRGEHWHISTRTYDHSALTHARSMLGLEPEWVLLPLVLPFDHHRDSSLSYMNHLFRRFLTDPQPPWALHPDGSPNPSAIEEARSLAQASDRPLLIIGTAFALADALEQNLLQHLPPNSRIVSTGGFKGRRVALSSDQLAELISTQTGLPRSRQHSEYGMTEWSSQLWSAEVLDSSSSSHARRLVAPPWTRVSVVHPETLNELPEGETGLVRMVDIANTDSVVAVQTSDLGRIAEGRLELLGRANTAPPRGCSLSIEELNAIRKATP